MVNNDWLNAFNEIIYGKGDGSMGERVYDCSDGTCSCSEGSTPLGYYLSQCKPEKHGEEVGGGTSTTELIRRWSIDRNIHTADPKGQALKLGEEFGELFEGLAKGNEDLTKDAIGDMYVVMTILSQQLGFTIEECIDIAYEEIKDRKGRMVDGVFVKESDL